MKNLIIGLGLLLNSLSSVAAEQPFLILTKGSGLVPAFLAESYSCQVFANRTEILRSFNSTNTREVKQIKVDTKRLSLIIEEAAKGKLSSTVLPTDIPTLSYRAKVGNLNVILLERVSTEIKNESVAAITLRNFTDALCR